MSSTGSSPPGLSLWIGPPSSSPLATRLQAIVDKYANELGTPKVILESGVTLDAAETARRLRDVASRTGPLKLQLTDIVVKDMYFQCVMAKVEESDSLMKLNRECVDILLPEQDRREPYWPHLSLVYGNLSADMKARVQKELRALGRWDGGGVVGAVVEVASIDIWKTEGAPELWTMEGSVALK
ncbi:RNA ligase/cyclic nucleotide phosphodiesterase [Zopfochytrium polystomum]|nr:RNA ligase/cyclic nucleotide phosphodiesterase [Zopfochytrium polystomum]